MDSSNGRLKLGVFGAVILLAVAGVAVLKNTEDAQTTSLEHEQALAKTKHANTPLLQLPHEAAVQTPAGWDIESDEPIEEVPSDQSFDAASEHLIDDLSQESLAEDDDIDSPMQVEEDAHGQEFVAELDPAVIVDDVESTKQVVGADGNRCFKNLKTCGAKKTCTRKCKKKCKPYAIRKCRPKKFCRCFCKHYGKMKAAKKCVVYQKLMCKYWRLFRCQRNCKKFCKKVPHCYCCPKTHIRRKCRQLCKRVTYRSKCARCRCLKLKCYKTCRFVCVKKYKK